MTNARSAWAPVTGEPLTPYLAHFLHRVLQDAYVEATAAYWIRRAEQFEAARPRRGEHHGQSAPADLDDRDQRLAAIAQACRNRATLHDLSRVEFDETFESLAIGAEEAA